ncbi:MAG TPA: glyoxalase superfamily protein [Bryobacteraceae bacterium]|nr:glyoxalase superfamily protein [Bryobacteraceae bacterium]
MARIDRIAPEIPVVNLEESLRYYESKLGFEVVSEYPDGRYAIVERDGVAIHLFEDEKRTQPVGVHMFTGELDELHDEFRRLGASLTQGVERKPWGNRDFRVVDPSGNELKFTEPSSVLA